MLIYALVYVMGKEKQKNRQEHHNPPPYPVRLPKSPYEHESDDFYNLFLEEARAEREQDRRRTRKAKAVMKARKRSEKMKRRRENREKLLASLKLGSLKSRE